MTKEKKTADENCAKTLGNTVNIGVMLLGY